MAEHTPKGPKGVKAPKALPQKPKRGKKPQDELEELRDHLPSVPRAPLAKSLTAAQRKMLLKGAKKKAETSQTGGIPEKVHEWEGITVKDIPREIPSIEDIMAANEQYVIQQLYDFGYEDIITTYENITGTIEYEYGASVLSKAIRETDEPYLTWEDLMYYPEKVSNEMTKYMTAIVNNVREQILEAGLSEEDEKTFDSMYDLIQAMQDSYVGDETVHFNWKRK